MSLPLIDPTVRAFPPIRAVAMERVKQDAKWGEQNHEDPCWLAILVEEVGECAECVCKSSIGEPDADAEAYRDLLEYELIQVAAVAVAWVECIRRQNPSRHDNEG